MAPKKPGTPTLATTVVLDETEVPKMKFDEESLPRVVKVRVKKTGVTVEVSRKYFLSNQGELEIV